MAIDRIRINCKKVYDNGVSYLNYSDELKKIQNDLNKSADEIQNAWSGADSHNFIVSLQKHASNLDYLINFLSANGELLKKNALDHSDIDSNFAAKMERSDINDF